MKRSVVIYVAGVLLVGFSSIPAAAAFGNELVPVLTSQFLLSVLSYPFGAVAVLVGYALLYMGATTPTEAIFVTTPIYALLGYLQWYRIMPAFYRK